MTIQSTIIVDGDIRGDGDMMVAIGEPKTLDLSRGTEMSVMEARCLKHLNMRLLKQVVIRTPSVHRKMKEIDAMTRKAEKILGGKIARQFKDYMTCFKFMDMFRNLYVRLLESKKFDKHPIEQKSNKLSMI